MEDNGTLEATSAPAGAPRTESTVIKVAGGQPEIRPDRETDQLKITLGEFEGPLDLLLYLIRQDQVNIYDIPIARITDVYLRYLNLMQELDLAVAGDFLVMAAQLIELKSGSARSRRGRSRSARRPGQSAVGARKVQSRCANALVARHGRAGRLYPCRDGNGQE